MNRTTRKLVVAFLVGAAFGFFLRDAAADQFVCTGGVPNVCINVSHPDQLPDVYVPAN